MLEWDDGGDHLRDMDDIPSLQQQHMQRIFHAALHEGLLPQHVARAAAGVEPTRLYYGTLSVAVLTLGLLLLVEACRRKLDRSATNRPIFQAVLDGVYRELATLGIVELFIHLLHEYYDDLDADKERVFVDVHFVLFYTAIFNALQSVILAVFAHRVSYHIWVQTEELELNHYVEIREEFDRVRSELFGEKYASIRTSATQRSTAASAMSNKNNNSGCAAAATAQQQQPRGSVVDSMKNFSDSIKNTTLDFYDSSGATVWHSLQRFGMGCFYTIKYPRLKAKHDRLLVQVRFHEMRVHFLQSYDLPLKLKVSTYLMRSEQQVIKHLIHVSTSAWLWLTGLISVLYFLTGVITNLTEDVASADVTVSAFFFIQMILFILISLWLYQRMQSIFMKIMEMKHLWDFCDNPNNDNNAMMDDPDANETHSHSPASAIHNGDDKDAGDQSTSRRFADVTDLSSSLAAEQLQLFFLSDPKIVVIAIQFMQFGYAIALAVVVVFWEDMNSGGILTAEVYLIVTLVCYAIYIFVTAQMLPKYTMCTSLGQLVDRKRLHETVAVFRLEEAERRRQQRKDSDSNYYFTTSAAPTYKAPPPQVNGAGSTYQNGMAPQSTAPFSSTTMPSIKEHDSPLMEGKMLFGDGSLPGSLEAPQLLPGLSQEVALGLAPSLRGPPQEMVPKDRAGALPVPTNMQLPSKAQPKSRSGMPAIDEKSATIEPEKASLLVDLVKMDTKALREAMPMRGGVPLEDIRKAERRDRRRNRRKSVSDGVALMSAMGNLNFFGGATPEEGAPKPAASKTTDSAAHANKAGIALTGEEHTPAKFAVDDSALLRRKERRRNRKKAVSASAAIQQMRDFQAGGEEPKEAEGLFDSWNTKDALRKPAPLADDEKAETSTATASPPTLFPQVKNRLFGTADDSTLLGSRTQQQRHQRQRRSRKKALSASAAVKLMQAGDDYDDHERDLEQESMMQFWGEPSNKTAAVPAGDEVAPMKHLNQSAENRQKSEQLVDSPPFGPSCDNEPNNLMLMPVEEDSEDMESSSRQLNPTMISPSLSLSPSAFTADVEPGAFDSMPTTNGSPLAKIGSENDIYYDGSDEETVETDRSVGGLSHVGDVSDFNYHRHASFFDEEEEGRLSLSARLSRLNSTMRHFLLTKSYTFTTHMLGTTLCFFLIGMRVEGFLKEQCIIPEDDHSWETPLRIDFWLVVTWILMFVLVSTYTILLFPAYKSRDDQDEEVIGNKREHWIVFLAAVFDWFLSVTCLMIFFGAEIQRCCNGNEYPVYEDSQSASDYGYSDAYGYGEEQTYNDTSADNHNDYEQSGEDHYEPAKEGFYRFLAAAYDSQAEVIKECKDTTVYCNCPPFGKRQEGGLGKIEPFVALIFFRLFRFLLARLVVQRFDLGNGAEKEGQHEMDRSRRTIAAVSTAHGGHGNGEFKNGTIVELWQAAISQHPEIVERYGEFSGELLQAMLGVDILEQRFPSLQMDGRQGPTGMSPGPIGSEVAGPLSNGFPSSNNVDAATNDHVTLDNKKYCKLAPEVQEIILAGKLGMPVKSCANGLAREPSVRNFASLDQPGGEPPLEFEVDVAQMELDKFESISTFEFPNARLVRSMRRCERKLLPLLDTWTQVDVILTNYEMVYISVSESDGADNHSQLKEAGRLALSATKGGKGLRLCDVTAGRSVIGHLSFSEILSLHVERKHRKPGSNIRSAEEATSELSHGHVEFWQESLVDDREESPIDIEKRWESVDQDSLKIQTIHGTLYLRFLSDLEDSEAHPERAIDELDTNNPLYKDIAFQWAQTIVRQCNAGQLKQALPHFGTDDELKDLLIIEEDKRHHRRFSSAGIRDIYQSNSSRGHSRRQSVGRTARPGSGIPSVRSLSNIFEIASELESGNADDEHPLKKGAAPQRIPRRRKITRFASDGDDGYASGTASEGNRAKSIV